MNTYKNIKASRYLVLIGGLVALLCSLVLYGALVLSAMYDQYRSMAITVQTLACENFAQTLSRVAHLGIEPKRLTDLPERIKAHAESTGAKSILVINAENEIIESWNYTETAIRIPQERQKEANNVYSFTLKKTIWLMHTINDSENTNIAYVLFGIDENQLSKNLQKLVYDNGILFISISGAGSALLIFLCMVLVIPQRIITPRMLKMRFYLALVGPLIATQCFFIFVLHAPLRTMQEDSIQEMVTQIGKQIGQDIQHIVDRGVKIKTISETTSAHLLDIQESIPWISGVRIIEGDYSLAVSPTEVITELTWNTLRTEAIWGNIDIEKQNTNEKIHIELLVSQDIVTKNLVSILLDTLTITVISFVFMIELLTLLMLKEEQARLNIETPLSASAVFIRPIIFLCMFAISLSISFIPLRMAQIDPTFLGLPINLIMGIPVSFEVCMVGVAVLFGGSLVQKIGWRPLLLAGTALVVLGSLASGAAMSSWSFIFSRALVGLGYGCIDLAAQVFVLTHSSASTRTRNLASMVAGLSAGLLCGSAFGGLIADRLGYSMVFYVTAVYMLATGIGLLCVLKKETWKPLDAPKESLNLRDLFAFLTNPRIASLLFLNILPCAFISVCLFKFYIPISLDAAGNGPATIGRVSMLFCLMVVYLGPLFGQAIDKGKNKILWLGFAGLICAASVIVLPMADGVLIAMLSVSLLGITTAIVSSAQGAYALELPATSRLGATRAMSIYNITKRVGQMLGPIVLGVLMVSLGTTTSLIAMAITMAVMSIAFILSSILHISKKKG